MKLYLPCLCKLLFLIAFASTAFAEGIRSDAFTLSGVVGGYSYDGTQHLETRPLVGVRGGYNFTSHFGVELLFDYVRTDATRGDADANMYRYGGDLLFFLFPEHTLVPYLAAGYSGITLDQERSRTNNLGVFNYGPGIRYFMNDDMALRADFRHLVFKDGPTLSNYEYTVGITYQFGGRQAAAKPVAEPAGRPGATGTAPPETGGPGKGATSTPGAETGTPQAGTAPRTSTLPVPAPGQGQPATPGQPQEQEEPIEQPSAAEPAPGSYKYCIPLNMEFDIDKAEIRPEYHDEIAKVGDFMKKYPTTTAVIEGHADRVGDDDYNMKLSLGRAESVVKYLEDKFGIAPQRLTARGFGKTKPVATNDTDDGKQKNRRIEAIIDCAMETREIKPPERLCMGLKVQFDTGRADIDPQYDGEIAKVADYMKKYPTTTALIEGHTDNVGGYEFNMSLSKQRAQNVVDYLVEKFGIERSRLAAKGYGYTRRIAYNNTPEGRQKNRRINAVIDCVIKTR